MKKEIILNAVRFLVLLALLLLLLALTGSPWALAGAIGLVLLMLLSWIGNFLLRGRLRAEIAMPTACAKGETGTALIRLRNRARVPMLRCLCLLAISNELTGERETLTLSFSAGAGKQAEYPVQVSSRYCGRLRVRAERLYLLDVFGVLPVRARQTAEARLTVLPELFPVELQIQARPAGMEEGTANKRGEDRSEVFQLREYQPGDDIRQIHWKLSSKLDTLIYREASMPESKNLLVFWDKRKSGTPQVMDALASAAASVCTGLQESGQSFTLCWTGQDELTFRDITDEDSLLQAIPQLVKHAGTEDCPLPVLDGYSRILYFGTEPEEQFLREDRIRFFLCGTAGGMQDPRSTVFLPQEAAGQLQRLEV